MGVSPSPYEQSLPFPGVSGGAGTSFLCHVLTAVVMAHSRTQTVTRV